MSPEPQTMKPFDPTKPVQYRNGETARIICTDRKNHLYPIVALGSTGTITTHLLSGLVSTNGPLENDYDLVNIPVKRKLTGWVNVYIDDAVAAHKSKQLADSYAEGRCRIACLDLSKYNIEFEEGEGL